MTSGRSPRCAAGNLAAAGLLTWLVSGPAPRLPAAEPSPLPVALVRAHAHNDYEHARPLLDALDQGFGSVEADIHLVDGRLLVAHDADEVRPDRTLQSLYLDPLRAQVERHGGRVHPDRPGFLLLIDFKTGVEATYPVLRAVLTAYADLLSTPATGPGAVTVILSGNGPWATVAADADRMVYLDGRVADLDQPPPGDLMPLISDDWDKHFAWRGEGAFPAEERARLTALAQRTHAAGRILRLWDSPDFPAAWAAQLEAGVDLVNTDQLAGLAAFLRDRAVAPGPATGSN